MPSVCIPKWALLIALLFIALVADAEARRPAASFDLRVTGLVLSTQGKPMHDYSKVNPGQKFKIRITVRNFGPGRSVPAYVYYAICKASLKVVKADVPIPALAPGQSLSRDFTAALKDGSNRALGVWIVEGDVEIPSPPDIDHYNNHLGLYHIKLVRTSSDEREKQGGE